MALTPTPNDTFIQEVDDAVRQDQMLSFWRRYGRLIVGMVVGGLIVLAGWLFWQHRETQAADAASEEMVGAIAKLEAGDVKGGEAALKPLTTGDAPAYRAVSHMAQATLASRASDTKGALAQLDTVVKDAKVDPVLRDVALVRKTALEFDALTPDAVVQRMQPLLGTGDAASPLFASAAELAALAHYRAGRFDQAGALFTRIAAADGVPPSLKARAGDMAAMLGSGVTVKKVGETTVTKQ